MQNEDLLYIEDANKKKLYYRFTPAFIASAFVPLIVILDDEATHFEYKMWNVLTPILDKESVFDKDLLTELINQMIEDNECEDHIYLYGSGKGSHTAILQSILCKANAVYVQAPQIRLKDINSKENDLSSFLNPTDSFPIFYICDNENTQKDEIEYFVEACEKYGIKYHLDRCVKPEDDEGQTIKEVLKMLEKMISQT